MAIRAIRCYSLFSEMTSILLIRTPPVVLLVLERNNIKTLLAEMLILKEAKTVAKEYMMEI